MKNRRKKKKSSLIYFPYVLVLVVAVFFYIWQHTQVIKTRYRINKLQKELEEIKNKNKYLKVKTNSLKSLSRIEKIATEELKMVKPKKEDIIILHGDNQ